MWPRDSFRFTDTGRWCVTLPRPQFEAHFVKRRWHSLNTSIGEESGLCSSQGDPEITATESKANRCSECAWRSLPGRGSRFLLAPLFVFACHLDRRGKGKWILGFIELPCLMWLQFLECSILFMVHIHSHSSYASGTQSLHYRFAPLQENGRKSQPHSLKSLIFSEMMNCIWFLNRKSVGILKIQVKKKNLNTGSF